MQASVLILAVFVLRLFLNKTHKRFTYFMWMLVLFRLCIPVQIESPVGLFNEEHMSASVSGDISNGKLDSEVDNVLDNEISNNSNTVVGDASDKVWGEQNNTISGTVIGGAPDVLDSDTGNDKVSVEDKLVASTDEVLTYSVDVESIVMYVWIAGMIAVAFLALIQLIMLKKRIRFAINTANNIWETDNLDTAFVMGVFRVKIYVPTNITESEREHIISHERMHIKHGDHIVRVVMLLANIIYWWNPLVWVATHYMKKDMEMLCDESVIKDMAEHQRREYLTTLLHCSAKNSGIIPVMSFGETNTENRIRHIINLREPKLYIVLVLAIFVVACVTCCTESASTNEKNNIENATNNINNNVTNVSTSTNKNENLPFECGVYLGTDIDNLRHMEMSPYYIKFWDKVKFWEGEDIVETPDDSGEYFYKYFYYDVNDDVINVYTDIHREEILFKMNIKDAHTLEFDGEEYMLKEYIYGDDSSSSDDSSSVLDEDEILLKGIYIPENGDGTHYIQIVEYGYHIDKDDMSISFYYSNFDENIRSYFINEHTIVVNGLKYIHEDYTDKKITININKTGYKQYDDLIERMVNIYNSNEEDRWSKFEELEMSYLWGYDGTFNNGGFRLIDLDGDGIEEMLIGENNLGADVIYGIYAIQDGELVRLCTGWDRNRYYLCEGNIIWNEGSSGAAHSSDAYYTYENGQWKLNMSVCLLSYYYEQEGIKYMATYEEDAYCEKDGVSITEEEYEKFLAIGKDKYIPINFTLFKSVSYN